MTIRKLCVHFFLRRGWQLELKHKLSFFEIHLKNIPKLFKYFFWATMKFWPTPSAFVSCIHCTPTSFIMKFFCFYQLFPSLSIVPHKKTIEETNNVQYSIYFHLMSLVPLYWDWRTSSESSFSIFLYFHKISAFSHQLQCS